MADKGTIENLEHGNLSENKSGPHTVDQGVEDVPTLPVFDNHEERRILRKIDIRVVLTLTVLYLYG